MPPGYFMQDASVAVLRSAQSPLPEASLKRKCQTRLYSSSSVRYARLASSSAYYDEKGMMLC